MIRISRFSKPAILEEKAPEWTTKYVAKRAAGDRSRPNSSQYAHPEIKGKQEAMSHGKCFYCEGKLPKNEGEVDHYIELAERPDLAFVWENLYLSCGGCHGKLSNLDVAVTSCVDPCNPADDPGAHLFFDRGMVKGVLASKGDDTIRKYKLDRPDLEVRRWRLLGLSLDVLKEINRQNRAKKAKMSPAQLAALRQFAEPSQPFSQMFRQLLGKLLPSPSP